MMDIEMERKTLIIDIDGTVLKQHVRALDGLMCEDPEILPGVREKFDEWDSRSYNIIFLTGRRESHRAETERQLKKLGLCWDQLIMGVGPGPRYLLNNDKSDGTCCAYAVRRPLNVGIGDVDV